MSIYAQMSSSQFYPSSVAFSIHKGDRYLRALAAFYIRMTFRAVDVYELLEPLLKDYRKLRQRNMGAMFSLFPHTNGNSK